MATKSKEEKVQIKQFKEGSSDFWLDSIHYNLNEDGEIVFCAGGIDTEQKRELLKAYIKRNKKVFKKRALSIFETEQKEYKEVLDFGKFSGKKVDEVHDNKYLKWMILNYNFTGKEKLKEEITEILKK